VIIVVRRAPLPLYFVPACRIRRKSRALVFETQQAGARRIEISYRRLEFLFCLDEFGVCPVEPGLQIAPSRHGRNARGSCSARSAVVRTVAAVLALRYEACAVLVVAGRLAVHATTASQAQHTLACRLTRAFILCAGLRLVDAVGSMGWLDTRFLRTSINMADAMP
jgi:hypothetical protein